MADSTEYFWGVELNKENPTFTWTFEEEDEDKDYMIHTLFLKNAILGTSAVKGERNLIQIETKNFEKKDLKQPFLSLTLGQKDMCALDVSFGHEVPVTFRLVEGSGPVALGGQQLVEYPDEMMSQDDESALDDSVEESELTEEESPKKGKRKAGKDTGKKAKKGKMDESQSSAGDSEEDDDESYSDEDEDENDEEEDMEEDESSPEKGKKKKAKAQKPKKPAKKASPKKAGKKAVKKGKK
jgi:hypothetical protein